METVVVDETGGAAVASAAWLWRRQRGGVRQRGDGGGGIYILDRIFINGGIVLLS